MENENRPLNAEQSLALISQMIQQTKVNVRESAFYFLVWGWVITICNFGMYGLLKFSESPNYAPLVWTLCIPAWIVTMFYGSRQDATNGVRTHLDKINMWLWIGVGIAILPSWIFGAKINWLVNAVILMPVGLATFLSGVILKFRALLFGGITFWIAGTICYLVGPHDQYLVGGFAMILGYLVPGYMLKNARNE
jgi:hypothetical protein